MDHRSEPLGLVEEDRVADLVTWAPPAGRCAGVAALQEAIDIVDAIETVIVQTQDDFVLPLGLEQRLVEHSRVTVAGHDLGDVVFDAPNLVPEAQE